MLQDFSATAEPSTPSPPPSQPTTVADTEEAAAAAAAAATASSSSSLSSGSTSTTTTTTTNIVVAGSVLLDEFLGDLLSSDDIIKLGFGFGYDLSRMQRSYPNLRSVFAPASSLVDVKAVTLTAFPEKIKLANAGLATVVASTLGMYIDKTEQCSDWQRRPLTSAQTVRWVHAEICLTRGLKDVWFQLLKRLN